MQCICPVHIKTPFKSPLDHSKNVKEFPEGLLVPCGKCLACKKARSSMWSLRLLHELSSWESAIFVTLTYSQEWLPKDGTLVKSHLQNFFKRLRFRLSTKESRFKFGNVKIKHYSCGEYGEYYQRPHYHSIIFGLNILDQDVDHGKVLGGVLSDSWWYGYVYVGSVNEKSVKYVAGYINKKLFGDFGASHYEAMGRIPPFQLQSVGLGSAWALRHRDDIMEDASIVQGDSSYSVPRYYRDILLIPKIRFKSHSEFIQNEKIVECLKKKDYKSYYQYLDEEYKSREMKVRNAEALNSLKSRDNIN